MAQLVVVAQPLHGTPVERLVGLARKELWPQNARRRDVERRRRAAVQSRAVGAIEVAPERVREQIRDASVSATSVPSQVYSRRVLTNTWLNQQFF